MLAGSLSMTPGLFVSFTFPQFLFY
uniref:Uncharacterized protein n=1 Tax=Anguilla anguilla TaxID=7936 RepID=A0A0E9SGL3_ANGAN